MNRQIVFVSRMDRIEFAIRLSLRTLLILVSIVFATISTSGQEGYRYKVRGRAVDERGLPVARAYVVVDFGPPTTWEDSSSFVESDASGKFLLYEGEESTPD